MLAEADGVSKSLFTESLRRNQAGRWLDREIDLSEWEGRRLRLTFETRVDRPRDRVQWTAQRVMPVWGSPTVSSKTYRGDRPPVVLISIDCLRADHVGAYGYTRDTTRHIDALAENGTVFEAAFSTSSWTLPTHFSMLTGLLPSFHGVTRQRKLSDDVAYLPELLSRAGYQVVGVASWYFVSQHFNFYRGFHNYRLMVGSTADKTIDAAIDLLGRGEGTEQFLFVHLIDAHWPYLSPKTWRERFGPRPPDISDLLDKVFDGGKPKDQVEIDDVIRLYDAEVGFVDEQIGRLLDELKARDLYDDTLIIVTADHGEAFYEHGHWQHTVSLYDEIIRIPLVVKWPGNLPTGRAKTLASQTDIFPTVLRAAGIDPPPTGALDLAEWQSHAFDERSVISEVSQGSLGCAEGDSCVKIAMRIRDLKYVVTLSNPEGRTQVVQQELYDLADDPEEQNDLSRSKETETKMLLANVRTFLAKAKGDRVSGAGVILDEQTKETLRALGYIN